jgi:hypothetical protein
MFFAASAAAARWLRRTGSAAAAAAAAAVAAWRAWVSAAHCSTSSEHLFLCTRASPPPATGRGARFLAAVGGDCVVAADITCNCCCACNSGHVMQRGAADGLRSYLSEFPSLYGLQQRTVTRGGCSCRRHWHLVCRAGIGLRIGHGSCGYRGR